MAATLYAMMLTQVIKALGFTKLWYSCPHPFAFASSDKCCCTSTNQLGFLLMFAFGFLADIFLQKDCCGSTAKRQLNS
jgi:hypothetical protein